MRYRSYLPWENCINDYIQIYKNTWFQPYSVAFSLLTFFFGHNDPNKLFSGLKRPWIKLRQLWERRYSYPHVRESRQVPGRRGIFAYGTWNPGLWNPEYGLKKIWNSLTIGIRNAIPGICRNRQRAARLLLSVPRLSWISLPGANEW